jgi:hypothetical protein
MKIVNGYLLPISTSLAGPESHHFDEAGAVMRYSSGSGGSGFDPDDQHGYFLFK